MNYLSVCSGIEAATCAWHPLGWNPIAFSEIEKFPSQVLAHHYPSVPNLGDMTKFEEWPDATIDLLVGGTPCQSFSVAGLRKGLADPRGNLMLTYGAIARRYRPKWLVWENVPGVLSSNGGRDFGTFLGMLGQLGYGFSYRVLDAQFFGVAQRRRRVFVVGCLGDWRSAAAVLFERHSLQGNPAPSREAGEGTAGGAGAGAAVGFQSSQSGVRLVDTHATLDANNGPRRHNGVITMAHGQGGAEIGFDRGPTPTCNHEAPIAAYSTCVTGQVTHMLKAEGFDASEDGTGRGTPLVPVPFDTTQITSPTNRSNPKSGDPCHPLAAGAHAPAIAFDCKASGQNGFGVGEIASTLRSMGHSNSHQNGGGNQAVAVSLRGREGGATAELGGEVQNCLRASSGGGDKPHVLSAMQVRRLTPRECERLQGFPDDYTLIPVGKKMAADGPRYKALGNSMAVPCMTWIGKRIQLVEQIKEKNEVAA